MSHEIELKFILDKKALSDNYLEASKKVDIKQSYFVDNTDCVIRAEQSQGAAYINLQSKASGYNFNYNIPEGDFKILFESSDQKFKNDSGDIQRTYLQDNTSFTFRVRVSKSDDKANAFLTIKSTNAGIKRVELEYDIPVSDAEILYNSSNIKLSKTRYKKEIDNLEFEFDFYENKSVDDVVEIEFENEEKALQFNSDNYTFLGKNVSEDKSYSNYDVALKLSQKKKKSNYNKLK